MSALLKTAKAHRVFTFLLLLEVLFLAGLVLLSFRPPVTQVISGEALQPTGALPVTPAEDGGVQVYPQESVERCAVFSQPIPLPSGAYDIEIQYQSVTDPQDPSYNVYDCAGWVDVELPSNTYGLKTNMIYLNDADTTATGRFWLRMGAGAKDLTLEINHYGTGSLTIQQVTIQERVEYRAARILGFLGLFLLLDFLVILLFIPALCPLSQGSRYAILGILILGFLSSLDFFMDYLFINGDLEYHLTRIASLSQALQDGQIPQRIQSDMLNGFGYASPLFYGELFLLLPALLLWLAIPIQTAYQIYAVTINFLTCAVAYWCFYKISGDWKKALCGTALYLLSVCRMLALTVRCAVGEYTAMAFLPLIVYGFYKIYTAPDHRRHTLKDYLPIIIGLTGILQSHMLTCEMTAFFIILGVILFWKKTFQPYRFLTLAKAAVFTFLLNAWYLVPFLQSTLSMDLQFNNPQNINDIELQAAYLVQLFTFSPTTYGTTYTTAYGEMPMNLGPGLLLSLLVFLFAAVWFSQHPGKKGEFFPIVTLFGLGGAAFLMASNLIPWANLVHLCRPLAQLLGMVQFPLRYLIIGAALLSFGTVLLLCVIEKAHSPRLSQGLMAVMVLLALLSGGKMVTSASNNFQPWYAYDSGALNTLNVAVGEYLPRGTDTTQLEERLVLTGEGVTSGEMTREGTRSQLWCENTSGGESYLDLPLLAYDNYQARGEDGAALPLTTGENNRIRVILPAGYEGTVTVEYRVPLLWRVCEGISLLTLMVLIAVTVCERKREKDPSPSLHQNLPAADSGEGVKKCSN